MVNLALKEPTNLTSLTDSFYKGRGKDEEIITGRIIHLSLVTSVPSLPFQNQVPLRKNHISWKYISLGCTTYLQKDFI